VKTRTNPRMFCTRCFSRIFVGLTLATAPAFLSAQVSLTTLVDLAAKNSGAVRLAQADVAKAQASLSQTRDAFIPSLSFGSGLPAFPEVGFTGNLPTIWDATIQSMLFSMPQISYIRAARAGLNAAQMNLKNAREQVTLDTSTAYIELDTVTQELDAVRQQETYASRLVEIEQQRAEAGVDPLTEVLQSRLTAAQLKLKRLHLETRAATLVNQLSAMSGLPAASILPDHASIPQVPAVKADESTQSTLMVQSAREVARAKQLMAKGDDYHARLLPEVGFGVQYNRNTTLLNSINQYYNPLRPLPANNLSSGFSISVPIFDAGAHAKARESAADALRAKVEAEQAQRQNDLRIATLTSTLRELDAQAEVASLKQQISEEQLKAVLSQMELGNGSGAGQGATPQLSPKAEQQARIDERQNFEEALDAGLDLSKARLNLLRALGHLEDWLNELHSK
jgi:outer membrane protein TolC